MEFYGLIPGSYPPNHDANYNQNKTARGNVTGVQTWSNIASNISTTRYTKYDIFGNTVEADVSCCQIKYFGFGAATYYSQPEWIRDGSTSGPNLTTSFQYNFSTGLVTQVTSADGLNTTYQYDTAWRLAILTASTGAVKTVGFDKDGWQNDQLSYKESLSYTDNGSSKVVTSKSWFDGAGRVIRTGTGTGASPASYDTAATKYDSLGRVLKQSNPYVGDSSGNGSPAYWTTNTYDLLSRTTSVTLPDNQTVQTAYTGATATTGARVTVTDQVGRQRRSEVDGLGRLVKVIEQNPATGALDETNYSTNYSYDVLDNLLQSNQGNQLRTFQFDALSRMTSETTPEGGTVSYTYTSFDQVQTRTDPRGVVTTYGYDPLNRLQTVTYNTASAPGVASTAGVTLTYKSTSPGKGQVSSITDAAGSESYSYNALGKIASKTRVISGSSYQTQYQYNTINQLQLMIYPSGKRVRLSRDTRGRINSLEKVDIAGNLLTSYMSGVGYTTAGQTSGLTMGNGVVESYGYSADRLQLISQTATKSGNTLMSLSYGYQASAGASGVSTVTGNSSQLMSVTGTIGGQSRNQAFKYDNAGKLLSATGWGAWERRYVYDRWGNRTQTWNALSGGSQLQTVALQVSGGIPTNRIANVNGTAQTYDNAGNVTGAAGRIYTYDGEGRQVSVDNGVASSSVYDTANRRVKKVAGGVTTHYVWEGNQVIAEYNGATGAVIGEYLYAGSRMVAREQGSAIRYFHKDRLSMRMITDGAGAVAGKMDHFPFGEDALTGAGESEKHHFTSYERDGESNTDYAINRQYETNTGRFMSPDPINGSSAVPQSLNRYAYTQNEPINLVDPSGLSPYDWVSDASIHGPGVYLDGSLLAPGMEELAWTLLGSEAGALAPIGSRWNPKGGRDANGAWEEYQVTSDGRSGWAPVTGLTPGWTFQYAIFYRGDVLVMEVNATRLRQETDPYANNRDVKLILETYRRVVDDLTNKGLRHPNAYRNNISATFSFITGSKYLGCGQQAGRVIEALKFKTFDSEWTFEMDCYPLDVHCWAKATSKNPSDPVILLDPWKDKVSVEPPGKK